MHGCGILLNCDAGLAPYLPLAGLPARPDHHLGHPGTAEGCRPTSQSCVIGTRYRDFTLLSRNRSAKTCDVLWRFACSGSRELVVSSGKEEPRDRAASLAGILPPRPPASAVQAQELAPETLPEPNAVPVANKTKVRTAAPQTVGGGVATLGVYLAPSTSSGLVKQPQTGASPTRTCLSKPSTM